MELEKKDNTIWYDLDDSVYTFSSSGSHGEYDDDELVDYDELEDYGVSDMKGSRIFHVEKIATAIRNEICCKKWALSGHKHYTNMLIAFSIRPKKKVRKEEDLFSIFVGTNRELIEDRIISSFSVAEDTYGFATSLYGIYGKKHRSHVFCVDADKVGVEM